MGAVKGASLAELLRTVIVPTTAAPTMSVLLLVAYQGNMGFVRWIGRLVVCFEIGGDTDFVLLMRLEIACSTATVGHVDRGIGGYDETVLVLEEGRGVWTWWRQYPFLLARTYISYPTGRGMRRKAVGVAQLRKEAASRSWLILSRWRLQWTATAKQGI